MRYFLIEKGQIVKGPVNLPKAWRNVSGLDKVSASELKAYGWLPEERVGADLEPSETQVKEGPEFVVRADKVQATWTLRDKTAQELQDEANSRASSLDAEIVEVLKTYLGKSLFQIVNEIRGLKGQQSLTVDQFKTWLKSNVS